MNELTTNIFEKAEVRLIEDNGEILFVGADVCKVLGFKNPNKAMTDHCKGITKRYPLSTAGGTQDVRVLNEPDVLRLITHSKLQKAQRFEKWVFEDVLPSIRRTGSYSIQPAQPPLLTTDAQFEDVMKRMQDEIDMKMNNLKKMEGSQNRTRLISVIPELTDWMCGHLLRSAERWFGVKPNDGGEA